MKAALILADAARVHPDGTFSLLRGGITQLQVAPGKPATFKGSLIVRMIPSAGETGNHKFKMSCVDEDGNAVMPEVSGGFNVASPPLDAINLAFDFMVTFPKLGTYQFAIVVDQSELDTWVLRAVPQSPEKKD